VRPGAPVRVCSTLTTGTTGTRQLQCSVGSSAVSHQSPCHYPCHYPYHYAPSLSRCAWRACRYGVSGCPEARGNPEQAERHGRVGEAAHRGRGRGEAHGDGDDGGSTCTACASAARVYPRLAAEMEEFAQGFPYTPTPDQGPPPRCPGNPSLEDFAPGFAHTPTPRPGINARTKCKDAKSGSLSPRE